MNHKKQENRLNSLEVSALKLRGTPGTPVKEDDDRWKVRKVELIDINVNGDPVKVAVPVHWTLLECLRYILGLVGSKQGCDKGDCGACTVNVDGCATLSCITLAVDVAGSEINTVESLASSVDQHPLVDSFAKFGAGQCGFCSPGMLMSASTYFDHCETFQNTGITRQDIAQALGGNLCRCTGYMKIIDAIQDAWNHYKDKG